MLSGSKRRADHELPSSVQAAVRELNAALTAFEADDALWTGVLTGAGERAFCAGADLKWMAAHPQATRSDWGTHDGIWRRPLQKPLIAAVNGHCLGGGMELALCCDLIIASETASFGMPELRNAGSYPGDGGPFRVTLQIRISGWRGAPRWPRCGSTSAASPRCGPRASVSA